MHAWPPSVWRAAPPTTRSGAGDVAGSNGDRGGDRARAPRPRTAARRALGSRWGVAAAAARAVVVGWRGLPPRRRPLRRRSRRRRGAAAVRGSPSPTWRRRRVSNRAPAARAAAPRRSHRRRERRCVSPGTGDLLLALDTGTRLARRRFVARARDRARRHAALRPRQRHAGGRRRQVADRRALRDRDRRRRGRGERERASRSRWFRSRRRARPSSGRRSSFTRASWPFASAVGEVRLRSGIGRGRRARRRPGRAAHPHGRRARAPRPAAPAAAVAAAAPSDPSTLAEQNDLFAAALAARRRGENAEAMRWLDRLIARYPDGPLIDSARAERRRLVDGGRRKRRPSEARASSALLALAAFALACNGSIRFDETALDSGSPTCPSGCCGWETRRRLRRRLCVPPQCHSSMMCVGELRDELRPPSANETAAAR